MFINKHQNIIFYNVLQLNLEIEDNFLSKSDQSEKSQEELLCLMSQVMEDLNLYKKCTLVGNKNSYINQVINFIFIKILI